MISSTHFEICKGGEAAPKQHVLSFDVGVKNLAYCLLDSNQKIIRWNIVDISHSSYQGRCSKLISELDNINLDIEEPITVIIERQMSKNRTMMIISGQILMYYTLKKKERIPQEGSAAPSGRCAQMHRVQ